MVPTYYLGRMVACLPSECCLRVRKAISLGVWTGPLRVREKSHESRLGEEQEEYEGEGEDEGVSGEG